MAPVLDNINPVEFENEGNFSGRDDQGSDWSSHPAQMLRAVTAALGGRKIKSTPKRNGKSQSSPVDLEEEIANKL